MEANPTLESSFGVDRKSAATTIEEQAEVVRRHYSLQAVGKRLAQIYRSLIISAPGGETEPLPHGEAILNTFLQLRRLHPIRLE